MKRISYVLPVFNESRGLREFYARLSEAVKKGPEGYQYDFWFINDGSHDNSLEILRELAQADKRVRVISFSRNFGHQMAITAGLDYAQGDAVIIMDTDLQDPPEVSVELVKKWREGYEVVYAKRRTRRDTPFKRMSAHLYYRTLRYMSEVDIPADTGDFRLLDRSVVREIRKLREANRFVRGMVSYVGFKQTAVDFDRTDRFAGETHYPLGKMIRLALDGITSFSTVPLRLLSRLGAVMFLLSFSGVLYALYMKIFVPQVTVSGWTLTIIAILMIGGVQMIGMGVLASYVGRIYRQVQDRPLYIVAEVIEGEDGKD